MHVKPMCVAVVVKDLRRSKKFFVEKLGMKLLDNLGHWVTVGQSKQGMRLHLCQGSKAEKGNTGIALFVDAKIDAAYAALKKKGVRFSVPLAVHEWGTECRLLDPDGNEFWLAGR